MPNTGIGTFLSYLITEFKKQTGWVHGLTPQMSNQTLAYPETLLQLEALKDGTHLTAPPGKL